MPYSIDEGGFGRPLPTDISLRAPVVHRRRGFVASITSAIGSWSANRRLDRARRARELYPQEIPNWLREDLGLPPLPPQIRFWWEDL